MTDTYLYLIREPDWDSDRFLPGGETAVELDHTFVEHEQFMKAVAELGARIVGAAPLQSAKHGGLVTPGPEGARVEEAVYTDSPYADSSELVTGYYAVEVEDETMARTVAALVPTGGTIEWRKVFPIG